MDFPDHIFESGNQGFLQLALEIFRFQYQQNEVYKSFVDSLHVRPEKVNRITDIPFLPIGFFKTQQVQTTVFKPELIFESSGTTGITSSKHYVKKRALYERSFRTGFERFYGRVEDYCVIGLLPSYLERGQSSLVFMVDDLVRRSGHPESGFYLHDFDKLSQTLTRLENAKQPTLLIGVTFALLDFAEKFSYPLRHTIPIETGGMKGRRKELTRMELQQRLTDAWGQVSVHAEYGMTELLSQAYARSGGLFEAVPWMRILLREEDDPLAVKESGEGLLNVIDLANLYSCSFIATEDIGQVDGKGRFEVSGRMDHSDLRGCSLLVV
jgi:hypothetical protein